MNFPNLLVVHPRLGVKTLVEFIALAKKQPGKLDFASTGAGSASHLAGELFNQRAGVESKMSGKLIAERKITVEQARRPA